MVEQETVAVYTYTITTLNEDIKIRSTSAPRTWMVENEFYGINENRVWAATTHILSKIVGTVVDISTDDISGITYSPE